MSTSAMPGGKGHWLPLRTLALTLLVVCAAVVIGSTSEVQAGAPPQSASPVPGAKGPGQPAAPGCDPNWVVVTGATVANNNYLQGVASAAPNDVWAVGYFNNGTADQTLIEHWNGSSWSQVPSPNRNSSDNHLMAVAVAAANDAWAVGDYYNGTVYQTLILHWDGSSWSLATSPNGGSGSNYLTGVTATGANDAWAVGYYFSGSTRRTLVEHWNGSGWSTANSPNTGANDNALLGVDAASSNDVWAVGYYDNGTANQTLILRWNGSSWSTVTSPNAGSSGNKLNGVSATSASNAWAVGYYSDNGITRTLVEQWDGISWTVVSSPNANNLGNYLYAVAAASPSDVYATGFYGQGSGILSLVEHWDGTQWLVVSSPSPGASDNELQAVTVAGTNPEDVWAVGRYSAGSTNQGLIERYNPCSACAVEYPDVPPGSTFYNYVHCLACRGIISGYPDGTFRPNDPITRGQLSKVVSNSAGFTENYTTATFQDVPVGSTFHLFIERLASRSIIAGYPCGGLGEPCVPPDNKPYFRPNANVTRGQTSKIVAIAKNLPPPPSGQQTFEDVPVGSTFWTWIEALASSGAIQGYACGGLGEPCVPPNNRPYFRPGANVTRGQASKIVVNTFFPNCVVLNKR